MLNACSEIVILVVPYKRGLIIIDGRSSLHVSNYFRVFFYLVLGGNRLSLVEPLS